MDSPEAIRVKLSDVDRIESKEKILFSFMRKILQCALARIKC
jgi:hypothetical protein